MYRVLQLLRRAWELWQAPRFVEQDEPSLSFWLRSSIRSHGYDGTTELHFLRREQ